MPLEAQMKTLEDRVDRLENELINCGIEKDKRIDSVHEDMMNMHSDMGALKGTVESLTEEIRCAVKSLREIAQNTSNMHEVVSLYEKWKGFSWVMKNIGFWGAILLAFVIGVLAALAKVGGI